MLLIWALTHFMPLVYSDTLYSENLWFSDVFRGYWDRPVARNGLKGKLIWSLLTSWSLNITCYKFLKSILMERRALFFTEILTVIQANLNLKQWLQWIAEIVRYFTLGSNNGLLFVITEFYELCQRNHGNLVLILQVSIDTIRYSKICASKTRY